MQRVVHDIEQCTKNKLFLEKIFKRGPPPSLKKQKKQKKKIAAYMHHYASHIQISAD